MPGSIYGLHRPSKMPIPIGVTPSGEMRVFAGAVNGELIQADTEYIGFRCDVVGTGAWKRVFIDDSTATEVPFTPAFAGEVVAEHVKKLIIPADASGTGYKPPS